MQACPVGEWVQVFESCARVRCDMFPRVVRESEGTCFRELCEGARRQVGSTLVCHSFLHFLEWALAFQMGRPKQILLWLMATISYVIESQDPNKIKSSHTRDQEEIVVRLVGRRYVIRPAISRKVVGLEIEWKVEGARIQWGTTSNNGGTAQPIAIDASVLKWKVAGSWSNAIQTQGWVWYWHEIFCCVIPFIGSSRLVWSIDS